MLTLKFLECRLLENEYLNQPHFDKHRFSKGALRNFDQLIGCLQSLEMPNACDLPFSVQSKLKEIEFESKQMGFQNEIVSENNVKLEQVLASKQATLKMLKMILEGQISYEFKDLNAQTEKMQIDAKQKAIQVLELKSELAELGKKEVPLSELECLR